MTKILNQAITLQLATKLQVPGSRMSALPVLVSGGAEIRNRQQICCRCVCADREATVMSTVIPVIKGKSAGVGN